MTRIIGLTGGIGSGKTTIANWFKDAKIPVYIADEAARRLMNQPQVQDRIVAVFGESVIEKGILNRQLLADVVFASKPQLEKLNAIIHPAVAADFKIFLTHNKDEAFVIREAAILFESGIYKDCDQIITVTAPVEIRIERVMRRDRISREQVLSRIANQWSDQEKIKRSDFVIHNLEKETAFVQFSEILKILHKP